MSELAQRLAYISGVLYANGNITRKEYDQAMNRALKYQCTKFFEYEVSNENRN